MVTISSRPELDRDAFARDGYAVVSLLDASALHELRTAYEASPQREGAGFNSTILSSEWSYREKVDLSIRQIVMERIAALLPEYRIGFCTFVVKSPNSAESEVPLHQDWSFVDERQYASIGLWCPLVDVDMHNGCLQVVAGSHAYPHPPRGACTPFGYPELVPYLKAECLQTVPMKAGEAMLFDNRLFHCSPPNGSGVERVAATAVLVPRACTMRYYHAADPRSPNQLEVFEVEDRFFLTHTPGTRPGNSTSLGHILGNLL